MGTNVLQGVIAHVTGASSGIRCAMTNSEQMKQRWLWGHFYVIGVE